MQHKPSVTYFATVSNDAIIRTAKNGRSYTAFGVAIYADNDLQPFHYNVVAFGSPGQYAKSLRRGEHVRLSIQAESQPDSDASIPLLTATFVQPEIPAAYLGIFMSTRCGGLSTAWAAARVVFSSVPSNQISSFARPRSFPQPSFQEAVMRHILSYLFIAGVITVAMTPLAYADDKTCPTPSTVPVCSYTATNGVCTVTIARLKPVTPPTIFVRRGCRVLLSVIDQSPFEDLSLDWKSSTTTVPPEPFVAALPAIASYLGKVTIAQVHTRAQGFTPGINPLENTQDLSRCEETTMFCVSAVQISLGQARLRERIRLLQSPNIAAEALKSYQVALQAPPGGAASDGSPWHDTQTWLDNESKLLLAPVHDFDKIPVDLKRLGDEITEFSQTHHSEEDKADVKLLSTNQDELTKSVASLIPPTSAIQLAIPKLKALNDSLALITPVNRDTSWAAKIADNEIDKKDYQTQVWSLDYTNKLLPTAKRMVVDPPKSGDSIYWAGFAEVPSKLPIISITVQFQSPSRIEVSSGVMVPMRPYHSYVKAAQGTSGTVIDNVVQETNTYAVVPIAFINYLVREWTPNRQRSAIFGTGGVGFNPASNAVEFGIGFTYSYRSIAISGLADIGRDTKLGGGFTVGQSLGPTNAAANPITATYWTAKPALALSVRIPLGGSASK